MPISTRYQRLILLLIFLLTGFTSPAEGPGFFPQADGNIKHLAAYDPHQFSLGSGDMVMQPAQDSLAGPVSQNRPEFRCGRKSNYFSPIT